MVTPRIGVLIVGHPDYANEVGLRMAEAAMAALTERGVQCVGERAVALQPWEAASQARQLAAAAVEGVLVFLATWIEAPTAIAGVFEVEHLPLALWGFPMYGPERAESTGSFVAYAVVKATLDRMHVAFVGIAGAVDDAGALGRAHAFCIAAAARARLRRARLGLIGYASMGMYSGTFNHALLRRAFGPEVDQVDTYTLVQRADRYAPDECEPVLSWLRSRARVAEAVQPEQLTRAARLYLALRDLASERRWDAVNVKCQYELSQQHGMVACVPLSLLAEDGVVTGCEGDVLTTATQLAFHLLTDQPIYYGDLLDLHEGIALFSSCGMAPLSLADEHGAAVRDIDTPGFSGLVSSLVLRPGRVTFAQLAELTDGYVLGYGTGLAVRGPLRQGRFPALTVHVDGDADRLLASLSGQHFAIAYGPIGSLLEMLARVLGVKVSANVRPGHGDTPASI